MARQGFIHDKMDLKFLVLYLMARVAAPIDLHTLTDLCFCDQGVDYFEFSEAVPELVETGHLALIDGLYSITDKGRENGLACESSLSQSIRRRCNASLAELNAVLRRNAQVRAAVYPRPDGGFAVTLNLDDESGSLLAISMLSPTLEQAEQLSAGFKAKPERIYNELLDTLLENAREES
ncbi:MAG: DUF4364 family protein [Oscillospiraceae bacterium]|nr:DUF4364 family protein [Oscillospiraceae bacterium]